MDRPLGWLVLIDLSQLRTDGEAFPLVVYDANPTSDSCDIQADSCQWRATQASYDARCAPYFALDDVRLEGNRLIAGGPDAVITLVVRFDANTSLPMTIAHARVDATVTLDATGQRVEALAGVIGGAVPKSQLVAAVENLSDDVLPIDKTAAAELLGAVIEDDIDLDGDGEDDGVSIGLVVETVPATLVR